MCSVPAVGEEVRHATWRQPAHHAAAQLERASQQGSRQRQRSGKPECRDGLVVQHGVDGVTHQWCEHGGEPGRKEVARGRSNALIRRGETTALALVCAAPRVERLVRPRNVANAHPGADRTPEVVVAEPFVDARLPPPDRVNPPHRFVDEGGQHVEKVVVGNRVMAVRPVHALERLFAAPLLVSPLADLGEE